MKEACWIKPCVKNSQGEDVVSKLWQDIYRMTGKDFTKSKELYKIATSKTFLDSVENTADFDENGQITARSFFRLSGREEEIDDIAKRLNETYSKDNISQQEAVDIVERFNSDESYKEDYVPVISDKEGSSNVDVFIVSRDDESTTNLANKLNNTKLIELIAKRLKELGVAYDFVGTERYYGRFSTQNAEKAADELYHIIQISNGADFNDTIVEEAAHLATVAMKDNSIIRKLLQTINEDTVEQLFTEDELKSADYNTDEGKLELAGLLVKKAIINKRILGFSNLMSRVKQAVFNVFSKGNLESLISDKAKARMYASQVANGFLYNPDAFDVERVKQVDVELYSSKIDGSVKLLQETLQRISILGANIKNASTTLWQTLYASSDRYKLLQGKDLDKMTYEQAAGVIAEGIGNLIESFNQAYNTIKDIDFSGEVDQENIIKLYAAEETFRTLLDLSNLAETFLSDEDFTPTDVTKPIQDAIRNISDSIKSNGLIAEKILNSERAITASILEDILGKDNYAEQHRIVFRALDSEGRLKLPKLEIKNGKNIGVHSIANTYIQERRSTGVDLVLDWFRHSNNSRDLANQLYYQAIRRLKINESRAYRDSLIELEEIQREVRNAKINPIDFYERYDDGSFTGYFIGPFNRRQIEQDKKDVVKKIKVKFIQELKDSKQYEEFLACPKMEKAIMFQNYVNDSIEWQDFEKELYKDRAAGIYSDKYINKQYNDLVEKNPQFAVLLNKLKQWKRTLDEENLKENVSTDTTAPGKKHYVDDLIPQYKISFTRKLYNLIRNRKSVANEDLYNSRHTKLFVEDVTADDFGSPITDKSLNEFNDEISLYSDGIRRIPLSGINELSDMRELSTDLFQSLSFYANMAHRYHSTQSLYPQLKIVDNALKNRSNSASVGEDTKFANSSISERQKMMDDFLTPAKKKKNILLRALGTVSMLASIRVLCINIMSALKNWNGGYHVILADALGGKGGFTTKSLINATLRNFNPIHLISSLATIFSNREQEWDKYKNLIRRWDAARNPHVHSVLGGNVIKHIFNYITNIVMANYSITDESLIAIIYDSYMGSQTLYDGITGEKVKLNKNGYTYGAGNNPELRENLVKKQTDIEYWNMLKSAIDDVNSLIEEREIDPNTPLTLYDKANFIDLLNYIDLNRQGDLSEIFNDKGGFKPVEEIKDMLVNKFNELSFREEDEILLCEKINDYITSSQGLYGALNANAIQQDASLAMFSKLKGWLFGFIQRNILSNPSALNSGYKQAVFSSELLALSCIFGNTSHIIKSRNFFDNIKFKGALILATFIPFALNSGTAKNKNERWLRKYLLDNGWDPDQLNNLSYFIIGWLTQFLIGGLCAAFFKGNYKEYGNYIYTHEEKRRGTPKRFIPAGIFFPKRLIETEDNPDVQKQIDKDMLNWSKQHYPFTINQKKNVTARVDTFNELKSLYKDTATTSDIFYCFETDSYYKIKSKQNRNFVKIPYGYYEVGTDAYNEHVDAITYKNYNYDKDAWEYSLYGAAYRLSRGVLDEGNSLLNPIKMVQDIKEIAEPIAYSAGVNVVYKAIKMYRNNQWDEFKTREKNFWLKKVGLELDGDGYPCINKDGEHYISLIDWYKVQDAVDRYNNLK